MSYASIIATPPLTIKQFDVATDEAIDIAISFRLAKTMGERRTSAAEEFCYSLDSASTSLLPPRCDIRVETRFRDVWVTVVAKDFTGTRLIPFEEIAERGLTLTPKESI